MSKESRAKWIRVKISIFKKYNHICCYCGRKVKGYKNDLLHGKTLPNDLATIEHIYPRSDIRRLITGNKQEYLKCACYECNTKKGHTEGDDLCNDPFLIEYDGLLSTLVMNGYEKSFPMQFNSPLHSAS